MIKLINSRGQLGEELNRRLVPLEEDVYIYHTWNLGDKTKSVQRGEYEKFKLFVHQNKDEKIIFISTYSTKENWYNHYKQKAEAFLMLNCERGFSIRLPTIIGRGILKKIKNKEVETFGVMELITLGDAARKIIDFLDYDGIIKVFTVPGEKILASTAQSIMRDI